MKVPSFAAGLCAVALSIACSAPLPAPSGGAGSSAQGGNTATAGASGQAAGGTAGAVTGVSGGGGTFATAGTAGTGGIPLGGSGGDVGVAGSAGASVGGGGGSGGEIASGKSAGCGRTEPTLEPARQYLQHDIIVDVAPAYQPDYTTREYHTYLPNNYDPNTAYPLFFWGNGCGVTQGNPEGIPAANVDETESGAILVFMIQEDGCFDAGKGGLADTPDVPYFETMLNDIEANYCIDKSKVFVGGYSSTAWFAATLSCSHGDRINGIGMAAGGQQDELPVCTGPSALILWAGNEGCGGNPIDSCDGEAWEGSGAVRDRLIAANGCSNTTVQWDTNPAWSSCQLYENCGKNPVVFCPHGGGHDTGGGSQMNSEGFWKLFKQTW